MTPLLCGRGQARGRGCDTGPEPQRRQEEKPGRDPRLRSGVCWVLEEELLWILDGLFQKETGK